MEVPSHEQLRRAWPLLSEFDRAPKSHRIALMPRCNYAMLGYIFCF
jgi:hypothetical protein